MDWPWHKKPGEPANNELCKINSANQPLWEWRGIQDAERRTRIGEISNHLLLSLLHFSASQEGSKEGQKRYFFAAIAKIFRSTGQRFMLHERKIHAARICFSCSKSRKKSQKAAKIDFPASKRLLRNARWRQKTDRKISHIVKYHYHLSTHRIDWILTKSVYQAENPEYKQE